MGDLRQPLYCNAANFDSSDSINYSCSESKVYTYNSGSCDCNPGYNLSGSSCVPVTCSSGSTIGLNTTTVDYGTGTKTCNGTNFDPASSINYSCSAAGAFSVTSGACSCNSGYVLVSGSCSPIPLTCTGGAITTSGGRTIHTFTSDGTFACSAGSTTDLRYLGVGSGGRGGRNAGGTIMSGGGGGGGGQVDEGSYLNQMLLDLGDVESF